MRLFAIVAFCVVAVHGLEDNVALLQSMTKNTVLKVFEECKSGKCKPGTTESPIVTTVTTTLGVEMITCPFFAGLANHLDMPSTGKFVLTAVEAQSWAEKFGLPSAVAHLLATPIRGLSGGKIDLRELPENGLTHKITTAIRSPLNARVGPDRAQYKHWLSHVKEDEDGCISTANVGQAVKAVTQVRIPMNLTTLDPKLFGAWSTAILSFADRSSGKMCTKVDVIESLFLDAKFPKSPDQIKPYSLAEAQSTIAEMMGSLAEGPDLSMLRVLSA